MVGKWAGGGGETPHGRVDFVNGTDFHAQPTPPPEGGPSPPLLTSRHRITKQPDTHFGEVAMKKEKPVYLLQI